MRYKAVLWDVYGTIVRSKYVDITDFIKKKKAMIQSFTKVVKKFDLDIDPEVLITRLIEGIQKIHAIKKGKGIGYPEVIIEDILAEILNCSKEKAKEIILYNEMELNNPKLQPGIVEILTFVKNQGIKQGIISNAQFYTPITLRFLLKKNKINSVYDIFNKDLLIFSYKLGIAKPSKFLFELTKKRLKKHNITPGQALFIGNDMLTDVKTAQDSGFKAALFAVHKKSIRYHKKHTKNVKPDFIITHVAQMKNILT